MATFLTVNAKNICLMDNDVNDIDWVFYGYDIVECTLKIDAFERMEILTAAGMTPRFMNILQILNSCQSIGCCKCLVL
jgi:hypothetical protein